MVRNGGKASLTPRLGSAAAICVGVPLPTGRVDHPTLCRAYRSTAPGRPGHEQKRDPLTFHTYIACLSTGGPVLFGLFKGHRHPAQGNRAFALLPAHRERVRLPRRAAPVGMFRAAGMEVKLDATSVRASVRALSAGGTRLPRWSGCFVNNRSRTLRAYAGTVGPVGQPATKFGLLACTRATTRATKPLPHAPNDAILRPKPFPRLATEASGRQ